jgi:hypothetical protein
MVESGMSGKSPSKKTRKATEPAEAADPWFFTVVDALAGTPGVSLLDDMSGSMRGLHLSGKSFGLSHHDRFMLKPNEERAAELIASGVGKPFDPSTGR